MKIDFGGSFADVHGPIARNTCSRRVRPSPSRATEPSLRWTIRFPSESVCTLSLIVCAEYGAPLTTRPPKLISDLMNVNVSPCPWIEIISGASCSQVGPSICTVISCLASCLAFVSAFSWRATAFRQFIKRARILSDTMISFFLFIKDSPSSITIEQSSIDKSNRAGHAVIPHDDVRLDRLPCALGINRQSERCQCRARKRDSHELQAVAGYIFGKAQRHEIGRYFRISLRRISFIRYQRFARRLAVRGRVHQRPFVCWVDCRLLAGSINILPAPGWFVRHRFFERLCLSTITRGRYRPINRPRLEPGQCSDRHNDYRSSGRPGERPPRRRAGTMNRRRVPVVLTKSRDQIQFNARGRRATGLALGEHRQRRNYRALVFQSRATSRACGRVSQPLIARGGFNQPVSRQIN